VDNFDRNNSCYKTKEDKRHTTMFGVGTLDKETPEDRELRLKNLRESRGRWVWDEVTHELVRAEDYYAKKHDIDAPQVSKWQNEWTVLATGKAMSKGELKAYCRANGKTWEN
jgi:hypothetical protein